MHTMKIYTLFCIILQCFFRVVQNFLLMLLRYKPGEHFVVFIKKLISLLAVRPYLEKLETWKKMLTSAGKSVILELPKGIRILCKAFLNLYTRLK